MKKTGKVILALCLMLTVVFLGTNYTKAEVEEKDIYKANICKRDAKTNKLLAGATLIVKDSEGIVKDRWVSTNECHLIEHLAAGKYTVEEQKAPEGYDLSTEKIEFSVSKDMQSVTVVFYNTPTVVEEKPKEEEEVVIEDKHSLIVNKIDRETGANVAGATLVLKDSTGNVVKEFVTTEASTILNDLTKGTYTLEETAAPSGYMLNTEKVTINVEEATDTYSAVFYNTQITKVPITDTDVNPIILGVSLVGLSFGIYKVVKTMR